MISEVLTLDALQALSPEEAAAMLQLRLAEQPGGFNDQLLAEWKARDPAHERAWDRAERVSRALDLNADNELLEAMRRHARAQSPTWQSQGLRVAASAAAVLVALGALAVLLQRQPSPPGPSGSSAPRSYADGGIATFTAKTDQPATFQLADGSQVTLDTGSAVTATFAPDRRRLRLLRGQAFFEVAHQAKRPFTVTVGDRDVTAVGTRFDVSLGADDVRIVLVEGRLSVAQSGRAAPPVLLRAGQQMTVSQSGKPSVGEADVEASTAWLHPSVTFRDETLDVVIAAINRKSPDQLVIRDPKVARLRITGVFRTGDAARFGRFLSQAYPVRIVRIAPGQLEIRSAR